MLREQAEHMDAPDRYSSLLKKLLRRRGRPHMDLQRPHHGTTKLVQGPSTPSRQLEPLIEKSREVGSKSFLDIVQKLGNVVTIYLKIMPNPC
ncbi:MAG: hypothetical protein P1U62_14395 [Alteraurantiacibacter sp. bin_em_oilr2.035]|nr:hypothetical protein [Alteraurantiacibacter sp. bin_em_oilr2.035]